MVEPDDSDCPERCKEAWAGATQDEVIDALIRSGCSNADPETLKGRQKKGLVAEFCGCHCAQHFPFAEEVPSDGGQDSPKPEHVPPWAKRLQGVGWT